MSGGVSSGSLYFRVPVPYKRCMFTEALCGVWIIVIRSSLICGFVRFRTKALLRLRGVDALLTFSTKSWRPKNTHYCIYIYILYGHCCSMAVLYMNDPNETPRQTYRYYTCNYYRAKVRYKQFHQDMRFLCWVWSINEYRFTEADKSRKRLRCSYLTCDVGYIF